MKTFILALLLYTSHALSETVDVSDFGAIPDDGVNDTPKIQAALDADPDPANNTTIHFPAGRYDISGTLFISLPDTIVELFPGAILRLANASNTDMIVILASRVIIRGGGKIDGNRLNQSGSSSAIILGQTGLDLADIGIYGLWIRDTFTSGIMSLSPITRLNVENNLIEILGASGVFIRQFGTSEVFINNNRVQDYNLRNINGHAAIAVARARGVRVLNNHTLNGNGNGIRTTSPDLSDVYIVNNIIDTTTGSSSEGVTLAGRDVFCLHNIVRNSNVVGILVWARAGSFAENMVIDGNIVSNSSQIPTFSHPAIQVNVGDTGYARNMVIVNNIGTDDQVEPTQSTTVNFWDHDGLGTVENIHLCGNMIHGALTDDPVRIAPRFLPSVGFCN